MSHAAHRPTATQRRIGTPPAPKLPFPWAREGGSWSWLRVKQTMRERFPCP